MTPETQPAPSGTQRATAREFLAVIFRRRWIILGLFAATLGTVLFLSFSTPLTYVSSGQVLVRRGEQKSAMQPYFQVTNEWEIDLGSEVETARSAFVVQLAQQILDRERGDRPALKLSPDQVEAEVTGKTQRPGHRLHGPRSPGGRAGLRRPAARVRGVPAERHAQLPAALLRRRDRPGGGGAGALAGAPHRLLPRDGDRGPADPAHQPHPAALRPRAAPGRGRLGPRGGAGAVPAHGPAAAGPRRGPAQPAAAPARTGRWSWRSRPSWSSRAG